MRKVIRKLIASGVYDQNKLFDMLYPTYRGHYSRLRDMIAEVKNG